MRDEHEIVSLIQREHEAIQGLFRTARASAIGHAAACGALLIEAKRTVKYGSFEKWIAANFPFTDRTARRYILIAGLSAEQRTSMSDLTFSQIEQRLAKPKPKSKSCGPKHPAAATTYAAGAPAPPKKEKRRKPPTISDAEYKAVRRAFVNSVIARCIPTIKRAAHELLGTDELAELRDAVCAVVNQFIDRATARSVSVVPKTAVPRLASDHDRR